MKKTTAGLSGILVAAALMLSACGNEAEDLASEYCDIYEDMQDASKDQDTKKIEELTKDLEEWSDKAEDSDVDEDEFKDAVKDECDVDIPGL